MDKLEQSLVAYADGELDPVQVAAVEELIARCHRGSPASRVDRVFVEETPGVVASGFLQKPTV